MKQIYNQFNNIHQKNICQKFMINFFVIPEIAKMLITNEICNCDQRKIKRNDKSINYFKCSPHNYNADKRKRKKERQKNKR